jgi:hypothetical protein
MNALQEMARTPISLMGILFLCFWAAIAEAEYLKYKDPKQPLNVRIKDLMSRMTLEEKIGQMVQIDRTVASAEVMKNYFIGNHYHQSFLFIVKTLRKKQRESCSCRCSVFQK